MKRYISSLLTLLVITGLLLSVACVAPALPSGETYYWRVKVQDVATGDAIKSPWSWAESFTVKPGLPVVRK